MFSQETKKLKTTSNIECRDVDNIETYYITKEMIASFQQHVNLSSSGDEEKVILEMCSSVKMVNMAALEDSTCPYFYHYLHVIRDLWDLTFF